MTEDEGLSVRGAVDWCGSGVTARKITRLLRLEGGHSGGQTDASDERQAGPGAACMIRPQCGSSGEANARAEVTVVDVTAAYWLGP